MKNWPVYMQLYSYATRCYQVLPDAILNHLNCNIKNYYFSCKHISDNIEFCSQCARTRLESESKLY